MIKSVYQIIEEVRAGCEKASNDTAASKEDRVAFAMRDTALRIALLALPVEVAEQEVICG